MRAEMEPAVGTLSLGHVFLAIAPRRRSGARRKRSQAVRPGCQTLIRPGIAPLRLRGRGWGVRSTRSSRCARDTPCVTFDCDVRFRSSQVSSRRHFPAGLALCAGRSSLAMSVAGAAVTAEAPLRVAVYETPPTAAWSLSGSISGVSVDFWRRTAEMLGREYRLDPGRRDEGGHRQTSRGPTKRTIRAITVAPERLAKVDFSYPAHLSGVADAACTRIDGHSRPSPPMPRSSTELSVR